MFFFFFKQKTAYEMRISDWSSDVCSSDLRRCAILSTSFAGPWRYPGVRGVGKTTTARIIARALNCVGPDGAGGPTPSPCGVCAQCTEIGRASCRERGCQYV